MKAIQGTELERLTLQALRSWDSPETTPALFNQILVFKDHHLSQVGYLQYRSEAYGRLETYINLLGLEERTAGRLLLLRFKEDLTARQIARKWNLTQDHVNRMQREAVQQLAKLIGMEEGVYRKNRADEQLSALGLINSSELIGRETETSRLMGYLQRGSKGWIAAITGLGGIGKSALANVVARRIVLTAEYDAVLWINAKRGGEDWFFEELGSRLGLQNTAANQTNRDIYLQLRRPHLIVIDGLDETMLGEEFVAKISWLANPSKFLLTTRSLPKVSADIHSLRLDELNRQQSRQLVHERARILGLHQSANELKEKTMK